MTLEEAIERFEVREESLFILLPPDDFNVLKLGIEALKAGLRDRAFGYVDLDDLLPGETKV